MLKTEKQPYLGLLNLANKGLEYTQWAQKGGMQLKM